MIPDMTIDNTPEAAALLQWAEICDASEASRWGKPCVYYTHLAANALLSIAVRERGSVHDTYEDGFDDGHKQGWNACWDQEVEPRLKGGDNI